MGTTHPNFKSLFKELTSAEWYAILIIAGTLTVLITVKHHAVVDFCRPITEKIRSWPAGWLIPIAVLIIVSFPPLVGHESAFSLVVVTHPEVDLSPF